MLRCQSELLQIGCLCHLLSVLRSFIGVHISLFCCHPGAQRTQFVVQQRFQWPSLGKDINKYVAACSECARNKVSRRPPPSQLHHPPVPSCPWSDISIDFVTGLPPSEGNTTILTIIDRFSKLVHFVPLPKLPSAKETAVFMLLHVVLFHGFPRDLVLDRGPQFISWFWKSFFSLLGATISLSSGYHLQSIGQSG